MIKRAILAATLAALALGSAIAAPPPKAAHKPPAPAAAPVWTVDKAASRLTFRATANGEGFDGVFRNWDAQIAFDPKNLKASHATVTVQMASVRTGDPTRDQMLPTPDWFEIGKFAKATFETTSIVETAPGKYLASGDLTLHGVKRPIALPFTLVIKKDVAEMDGQKRDVAQMDGQTTLDRTQFGVGKGQAGGTETVAAQVQVTVKLTARKGR